jgi:hypothetical protein
VVGGLALIVRNKNEIVAHWIGNVVRITPNGNLARRAIINVNFSDHAEVISPPHPTPCPLLLFGFLAVGDEIVKVLSSPG